MFQFEYNTLSWPLDGVYCPWSTSTDTLWRHDRISEHCVVGREDICATVIILDELEMFFYVYEKN